LHLLLTKKTLHMEQNQKKIFANAMIVVILIAAMSVGLISCGENKEPEPNIPDWPIMRKWTNLIVGYTIEFKTDGTYSFMHSILGETNGFYRITERKEDVTWLISWFNEDADIDVYEEYNAIYMYKILVSGNVNFDQLWVYYSRNSWGPLIGVEIYNNDELLEHAWIYLLV